MIVALLFIGCTKANKWQLSGLEINNLNNNLQVTADTISIPFFENKLSTLVYQCKSSSRVYPYHKCNNGVFKISYQGRLYEFKLTGWFDFINNSWDITVRNSSDTVLLSTNSINQNHVKVKITQMPIIELKQFLQQYIDFDYEETSTVLTATLEISFIDNLLITADYLIDNITWESKTAEYIFVDNQVQGTITVNDIDGPIEVELDANIPKGEALLKEVYLNFGEYPINIKNQFLVGNNFHPVKSSFILQSTEKLNVQLEVLDWTNNNYLIAFEVLDLDVLYRGFLASYLEINGIEELGVSGFSKGQITIENNRIKRIHTELENIDIEIPEKKIDVNNLNAKLNWQNQGEWLKSEITWDDLLLAGMPISRSSLVLQTLGQQLQLQEKTQLPIFDGSLLINKLELRDLLKEQNSIDFEGELQPISIRLITEKLGWAAMNGSISGKIPGMKKSGNRIIFDGFLDLKVFDGEMKIKNLSIERLFGIAPVIAADISFDRMNLQQITSTFDFGEITGLVNGEVNGLRITNWKADRLEAQIYSSNNKNVKQTISQRALDNISSIGGIQGAISRSFLRFFDSFQYKNIGIGCKLRNAICEMSGIQNGLENKINTYKLIEGKGIPSINIIGFRKFIDWEVFLDRLLNAGY